MFFLDFFNYILYSFIVTYVANRGVAQFGSARGLGPWGRGFESLHLDQYVVGIAQLVRAPDCGSGGREFDSHYPPQFI